jgi:hypothetical protein
MMRSALAWMLLVGLGGCAEPLEAQGADETGSVESVAAQNFDPFPAPGQLCSGRRMIVHVSGFSCPAATGWKPVKVFPTAGEPELRHYCRYNFTKVGEPTAADLAFLPPGRPFSPDCLVVTPLASEDWGEMREAFHDQIDPPQLGALGLPATTTWVAVVDTSPRPATSDGEAARGADPHGYVLARILREAGCPNGSSSGEPCALRVHHELALPWSFDGTRWFRPAGGGHFGYQSELADAIHRAVDAWSAANVDGSLRLVINLSVGWLPYFGGDKGDSPLELPGAREVYAAIQKARCRGALVFAAAGNWSGGTQFTTGLLYPAGWARFAAPTVNRCSDFLGAAPGYNSSGPLLEAVGGVDGQDQELANARPDSMPRLVAPGFLGAAADPLGGQIPTLTGTSVSTAVAAAAAAVSWAYAPSLDAPAIARAVYDSGPTVDPSADPLTCSAAPCPPVHRVSVCGALRAACAARGGGCGAVTCLDRPAFADARPLLFAHMLPPPTAVVRLSSLVSVGRVAPAECGRTDALYRPVGTAGPGPMPCPDQQAYAGIAHPDVGPQPSGAGCRVCAHMSTSSGLTIAATELTLFVQLDPSVSTVPVGYPSLLLVTRFGNVRFALWEAAPGFALAAGPVYALTGVPLPAGLTPADIVSARLSGRTARGEAWSAELAPLAGP